MVHYYRKATRCGLPGRIPSGELLHTDMQLSLLKIPTSNMYHCKTLRTLKQNLKFIILRYRNMVFSDSNMDMPLPHQEVSPSGRHNSGISLMLRKSSLISISVRQKRNGEL